MPSSDTGYTGNTSDTRTTAGDQISNATSQVKEKVSGLGRSAAEKIDENKDSAAGGLDSAASTLHERAESLPGGEKVTHLAHATADKLSAGADYVRQHDVNSMMADVERLVKNNPGASLMAAAALGFLIGRTFSSRD